MVIADAYKKYRTQLPQNVTLVAVSKTHPTSSLIEAYNAGARIFGENKVQELCAKYEELPKDIQWHFIGHLQTNKVKYIAPFVSLIHAVDSISLLKEIQKQAQKHTRVISCLLQFHIAQESTKFGLNSIEADELLKVFFSENMPNVKIVGVMGMATYTENTQQIADEFSQLHLNFKTLQERYFKTDSAFKEISMGMSQDYEIAIEQGSTMVRIGSSIFGERNVIV